MYAGPSLRDNRADGKPANHREKRVQTAVVVYRSHSGVTRRYAEEIGGWLAAQGIAASVASVGEADPATALQADYLFLGCWTSGLFVIRQHPDEPWLAFVRDMPDLRAAPAGRPGKARARLPKVALFTTYKLATGSQFAKMRTALADKTPAPELELKSRGGRLSDADRRSLERFVAS
jgi:hypothetical protein